MKRDRRKAALKAWETRRKKNRQERIIEDAVDGVFMFLEYLLRKEEKPEPEPEPEKPKGRDALSPFLRG